MLFSLFNLGKLWLNSLTHSAHSRWNQKWTLQRMNSIQWRILFFCGHTSHQCKIQSSLKLISKSSGWFQNPNLYNLNGDHKAVFFMMECCWTLIRPFYCLNFWFHLCRHNLRPLLRSHALTWAWSLLRTCSVINLMNKHHVVISFFQSTDSDIFGLTVWRDAEGTCFYWVLCQICPLAAVMAAFY